MNYVLFPSPSTMIFLSFFLFLILFLFFFSSFTFPWESRMKREYSTGRCNCAFEFLKLRLCQIPLRLDVALSVCA
ncbi:hypothetical protein I7I50_02922 [Histoplasma capsulatum G186AR]|uniref:Uncharacterized protein n=1 Tax=Ajellomyces capsulatus TaxID=5037 RepID=A0A8H7Z210_AJECA|nr:hypothetical protein I7I52_00412 [Histoplasma capsulatum]QSS71905.1 hypothetical protein I7I50_02922 [Histoplasma capsulatum G186AR]